ncbi:MAG: hypothetical protein IT443_01075 [Phycisphaeraceae bacterium]|nr:hypothetical protein [Phycisphaeraceae bacterium]
MSIRSLLLGLALGLMVSGLTYFNDAIIKQGAFIGGLFPMAIFAALTLWVLLINPFLGTKRLGPRELVVATAIGLAACSWPPSNYFRGLSGYVAMPANLLRDKPAWQGTQVLSYMPGASPEIAGGHIRDWGKLVRRLHEGAEADANPALAELWQRMPEDVRATISQVIRDGHAIDEASGARLLNWLNELIRQGDLPHAPAFAPFLAEASAQEMRQRQQAQQVSWEQNQARVAQLNVQKAELAGRIQPELDRLDAQRMAIEKQLRQPAASAPADGGATGGDTAQLLNSLRAISDEIQRVAEPVNGVNHQIKLGQLEVESDQRIVHSLDRRLTRQLLVTAMPEALLPQPAGEGWLLTDGEEDPLATGVLLGGWDGHGRLGISELPWRLWWPTLVLWCGLGLLLAFASLFLILIVHPQWAQRELLPYPIARFAQELTETEPGSRWPVILRSRLLWLGAAVVFSIHLVNGIQRWFPGFISIPVAYNFLPLTVLFPVASRAPLFWAVYLPRIYFSIVAFAFLLPTGISLSIGLVGLAYMIMASLMFRNGIAVEYDPTSGANANLILFGAWLGGALIVLYVGRRYYLGVVKGMVGLAAGRDVPPLSIWAARGLLLCVGTAVWLLIHAGMDWPLSVLTVFLVGLTVMMIARINAETGMFFVLAEWLPSAVLLSLLGDNALGPTGCLLVAMTGTVLVAQSREALTPFLANAFQMADRTQTQPRKLAPALAGMLAIGFIATLLVTFWFQYNMGVNLSDEWAFKTFPSRPLDVTVTTIDELAARQELTAATAVQGWDRFTQARPRPGAIGWISVGLALVMGTALARLRFAWWPLHPVMFMVFGTHPAMHMHYSFLLGWLIKLSVVKLGGVRTYHAVLPLMFGLVIGELLISVFWTCVGAIYYAVTGLPPIAFSILVP